jgi:hypothetical protein
MFIAFEQQAMSKMIEKDSVLVNLKKKKKLIEIN